MTTWDDYFMLLARAAATKSKDPSTQVGAVIVGENNAVVGIGYNGPPRGTDDAATLKDRETRLLRTLHAEANAIMFARGRGTALYTTMHPCAHCAALIIQAGIKRVVCPSVPPDFEERWWRSLHEARSMFKESCVTLEAVES